MEKPGPIVALASPWRVAARRRRPGRGHDQPDEGCRRAKAQTSSVQALPSMAASQLQLPARDNVGSSGARREVEVAATIRIGDMPVDDAELDDVALELFAETDQLPLDAIALTIDADIKSNAPGGPVPPN